MEIIKFHDSVHFFAEKSLRKSRASDYQSITSKFNTCEETKLFSVHCYFKEDQKFLVYFRILRCSWKQVNFKEDYVAWNTIQTFVIPFGHC